MSNWYERYRKTEWKIARYEGSEQERSIWYHGTKESNLQSILSQGLIVNPKNRAWDEHSDASWMSPSQKSIGGIYVSRSMLTARIAAQHNLPKGEDRILVIMELQPRSLVADEDSLTHYVKNAFADISASGEWLISELFMANAFGTNSEYVNDCKNRYLKTGINLIDKQYGPLHTKMIERLTDILSNGWEIVLNRQASYIDDYTWNKAFYRNISTKMNNQMIQKRKEFEELKISEDKMWKLYDDYVHSLIPVRPDKGEYEDQYLNFMDQITRTVKDAARPERAPNKASQMTARSVQNIGFSGSNHIVSIVKIDENMDVELVYGTLPDDFKQQWKQSTGALTIVNRNQVTQNSKAAKNTIDKIYKVAAKSIWYHGTLISNYPKIASEGLLAQPKKRLWDKTDKGDITVPSKASLPGIYLTNELIEAIEAPYNALDATNTKKIENSILLTIVQADTQSLYIDEDAISFEISSAIEGVSEYLINLIYLSGVSHIDTSYFERMRDRFVERQMQMLNKKFSLNHPDLISRVKNILREGFINVLTRQVAYSSHGEWIKAYLDIQNQQKRLHKQDANFEASRISPQPTPDVGEEMFRGFMDQLTKTLKFYKHQQEKENVHGEYWTSGRYPNNITYNGSTKILTLVAIEVQDNEGEPLDTTDYGYKVLYGTLPPQFMQDWKRLINPEGQSIPQQKTEQKDYEDWYANISKF